MDAQRGNKIRHWLAFIGVLALCISYLLISILGVKPVTAVPSIPDPQFAEASAADASYRILAWNDLGMHCYNRDFQYLAVLPPYNTVWAQVVQVGDPPQIITTGITLTYAFVDNSFSVGKSNFWDYEDALFGVNLPDNIGLTGKGLTGTLDLRGTAFVAEGIPVTEFRDSDYAANQANPTPYPYQLAVVTAWDSGTMQKLAEATIVVPVSTEMHCDNCHYDGGVEGISTGSVELNILTLHDEENSGEYPGTLVGRAPILCAECHASNALNAPGDAGLPNFSRAMHSKHADKVPQDQTGCYQCHPGPETKCLRDVMSTQKGMDCIDCHGTMDQVKENPDPWLNEPRCDDAGCHDSGAYDQNQDLYRFSTGHGDIYCEGCHDSTHAIAPSREPNDAIKFLDLQGVNLAIGAVNNCTVCHMTTPLDSGPHAIGPGSRYFLPIMIQR